VSLPVDVAEDEPSNSQMLSSALEPVSAELD